ncbi:MAG TPA: cobalamin B12-binding domain-containing protein, partial [Verrucomicrobiota bacterium]|nr:cobalamin B12-binding domain-containing protein [Verrucomicrobiota bacterium]
MIDVLLTTINAKYIHTAFGLRYLFANLGDLKNSAEIMEFDLQTRPIDIAEAILNKNPRIVGIGVYIWNIREVEDLTCILKKVNPEIVVVLGGPEVSYEFENQPAVQMCDYLIRGEGDIAFAELCKNILSGQRPESKVILPPLPDVQVVKMPYEYYTDEDLKHRIIYVES